MASLKPLIMRSNRLLGASLVERNLVSIEALDSANERLLEILSSNDGEPRVSLLAILANEKQYIKEGKIIEHLVEDEGLGIIDVRNIEMPEDLRLTLDKGACWATWTVPFDQVEDTLYLATAFYLSPAVRAYWEGKSPSKVVWFVTTMESVTEFLETIEAEEAKAALTAKS